MRHDEGVGRGEVVNLILTSLGPSVAERTRRRRWRRAGGAATAWRRAEQSTNEEQESGGNERTNERTSNCAVLKAIIIEKEHHRPVARSFDSELPLLLLLVEDGDYQRHTALQRHSLGPREIGRWHKTKSARDVAQDDVGHVVIQLLEDLIGNKIVLQM